MVFVVRFDTDGAAFDPPEGEIARILRHIADRVEGGADCSHFLTIRDVNGNDVGRFAHKPVEML